MFAISRWTLAWILIPCIVGVITLASWVIRNQLDGKIPVSFSADSTGVGGDVFVDGEYLGKMNGLRFADGRVMREWRVLRGKRVALLVTKSNDSLQIGFEASESGIAEFRSHGPR